MIFYNFVYGIVFHSINSLVDSVFEAMYTLFPLIYLTTGKSIFDLRSLGLLKQQNWFILLQSMVAMIFLLNKGVILTTHLNPYYIAQEYWQLQLDKFVDNLNKSRNNSNNNSNQPLDPQLDHQSGLQLHRTKTPWYVKNRENFI